MAKSYSKSTKNPRTEQVWKDLEAYKKFCVSHGYKFNEADLYNMRTYPYQQYNKFRNGKNCKNQWEFDLRRFHSAPSAKKGYQGKKKDFVKKEFVRK